MESVEFTIEAAPVTKKNHQQIMINRRTGKPFVMPSKQYRAYQEAAKWFVPHETVTGPVNVRCLFYMPTRRRVDLVNLLEAADDVLVYAGLLEDDNCAVICGHDGSRVLYDRERPRTEIVITEAEYD